MTYDKNTIVFQPLSTHPNFKDLTGQVFNYLTVLGYAGRGNARASLWWCRCKCGNITKVSSGHLVQQHTGSCGCQSSRLQSATTHGLTGTPLYKLWIAMIGRCENPNDSSYYRYGERGITVSNRWRNGENGQHAFLCFLEDMGERPSKQHSIERKENI